MTFARRNDEMRFSRRALLGAGVASSATWLIRRPARAQPAAPLVIDVHAHNFNETDLPITGFSARFVPFLSDFSREISHIPEDLFRHLLDAVRAGMNLSAPTAAVELGTLSNMAAWPGPVGTSAKANSLADDVAAKIDLAASLVNPKLDLKAVFERAAQVIYLISHGRAEITSTIAATYPEASLFIPMLVDYDAWVGNDHAISPLDAQIQVHGALAKKSITTPIGPGGARVHPFVAFDPARADGNALKLVQTAIEQGFVGVKVYPPVGFAPALNSCLVKGDAQKEAAIDSALDALYDYCTKNDVPITTHCSTGNEFGLGYRDLVAPHRWEPVLAKFPNLRLNLGHFGHMEGVDSKRGFNSCEAWIRQAAALMDKYPNVYADLSGSDINTDATKAAYARLLQQAFAKYKSVPKRMMYGSDWWLNRFFDGAPGYFTTFKANFTNLFPNQPDLLADVLAGNARRFLGFAKSDAGAASKNGTRLAELYHGTKTPLPPWLEV